MFSLNSEQQFCPTDIERERDEKDREKPLVNVGQLARIEREKEE